MRVPLCIRSIVSSIKFFVPLDTFSTESIIFLLVDALRFASIRAFFSISPQGEKYISLTVLVKPLFPFSIKS